MRDADILGHGLLDPAGQDLEVSAQVLAEPGDAVALVLANTEDGALELPQRRRSLQLRKGVPRATSCATAFHARTPGPCGIPRGRRRDAWPLVDPCHEGTYRPRMDVPG